MKKYNIALYIFFISFVGSCFQSCDSYLDVNENPNKPIDKDITLAYRLPSALYNTAYQESVQLNQLGCFWGGYWGLNTESKTQYANIQQYNGADIMSERNGIPIWENGYTYANNYYLILNQATEEGSKVYGGIARIMLAWHFMRLADIYGDIPLDQAFNMETYPHPEYEDGIEVYKKTIDLLTEAVDMLKAKRSVAEAKPSSDDIVFNGDVTKWIQFANTIKLRALIRQSEVAGQESYIASEIDKIKVEGSGFLTESALANPGFTTSKPNPYWSNYYRSTDDKETSAHTYIRPTEYVIAQYEALNDPRLAHLYTKTSAGKYQGVIFGYTGNDDQYKMANTSALKGPKENKSETGAIFKSATQSLVLLSDFESYFLQAEAAQRGWISDNAASLYQKGIEASCAYMGVSPSEISSYLAQPSIAYDGTIKQIILQKWLALNSINGIEAWNDFRRLGLPQFPNSATETDSSVRPKRLLYPETETQTNVSQVKKRNITDITKNRVWWDVH
ncbi:SusD/RagB family nutrient-binding outer membrane lipoprotein [Segatella paludivivens]|uniref:SusD/RagB family nutrient-binding outer membrane lipoprotein n=1 Tax=Segatella paludivivens TaxID=185294 RepID=UPI00036A4BC1|nr:SusD/RagB family nutrient-binding outer membrane lipoprotein [Segatella paludivivens]